MDEQVINDLYQRAQSNGYAKSREEFIKLLHSDNDVFNDMFSYVKGKGYQKNENDFSTLIGKTVGPDLEQSKKKRLIEVQKPSTALPLEDGSLASQKLSKVEKAVEVPDDYKRINALSNKYTPVVSLDKEGKTVFTERPEGLVEIDLFPEFTANKKKDPMAMREAASRLRGNIEEKINDINTGKRKVHYLSDRKDKLEKDLNEVKALQIKANKEVWTLDDAEYEEMVATERVDQSGSIAKKAFNRVMAAISPYKSIQLMSNETSYNKRNLKPEFSLGMKVLSGIEPVEYERVLSALKNDEPISSTDIANITAYGYDIKDERLKKEAKKIENNNSKEIEIVNKYSSQLDLLKNDIQKYELAIKNKNTLSESDIADYNSKITNYNAIVTEIKPLQEKIAISNRDLNVKAENLRKAKEDNLLNSPEVLRSVISEYVAERLHNLKKGINPDFKSEFLFGHTWNYTDDEIKLAAEEGLKEFGIDPNDKRVVAAIKYLQDNEGVWLFQNSIAKSGGIRELGKGVSDVVSGTSKFIENLPKSEYEIYAEAKSAGSVNVADKRLKGQDEGVIGVANDVLKGVGQFGAQAGAMYLTGGVIGGTGRAILGRAGTAALAGDIAIADMSVGNLIGSTLLKAKNPLSVLTTTYAMEYDSNLKQALSYTSDNSLARNAAALNTAISSATELILSPLDIAKGIVKKFSKGETKDLLNILSDKSLKNDPSKLKNYITKAIKGVGGAGEVVAAEILEEEVVAVTDYLTNQYLNPESESFQNRKLSSEMAEVAYQTGVSMALPAILNGVGSANANTFSKSAILVASQNRLKMIEGLGVSLANKNISKEEYAEQVQLVNISAKANDEMPNKADGIKLNADEKANYIWSRVTESFMNDKMKATDDEAQKMILKKKIAEQQNYRAKILGGEEILVKPSYKVDDNEVSKDEFISLMDSEGSDRFRFEVTGDSEMKDKLRSEAGLQQEKAPEVTSKRTDRIAEIEFALSPESTIVIEDAEKTKLQTELETLKTEQDAIQKQATDAGVLRTEEPEVGLQQVGEGNKFETAKGIKEATIENEKPKILSTVEETLGALNTLPTEEKTNYTFTNEKGEQVPLNTNEKVAAELFHQAIAVPEEERTVSQQSAVDAIEVSLKTQIDEQKAGSVGVVEPKSYAEATDAYKATELGSSEDAKNKKQALVEQAETEEGKKFVESEVSKLEKNDDGTITVFRSGTLQDGHNPATTSRKTAEIIAAERKKQGLSSDIVEVRVNPSDISVVVKGIESEVFVKVDKNNKERIEQNTTQKQKTKTELLAERDEVQSELEKTRKALSDSEKAFSDGTYPFSENVFKDANKKQKLKIKNLEWQLSKIEQSLKETPKEVQTEVTPENIVGFNESIQSVVDAAAEYKKTFLPENRQKERPPGPVRKLLTNVSKAISNVYDKIVHNPEDPKVKEAYEAMMDDTKDQYKFILSKGLNVEKHTGTGEPYANSKEMLADIRDNNTLKFLPNDVAFGQGDSYPKNSIGLQPSGVKLKDGYEMTNSELFRVVHDYFGHGILGNQFGAIGEENATLQHLDLFSDKAAPAVIFQTRGQNSWVNFSGKNDGANELRKQARELIKQGKTEEANKLFEKANKIFKFAEPKDNIFPNEFNFKKYDTARRLENKEAINNRAEKGTDELSNALETNSNRSRRTRGVDKKDVRRTERLRGNDVNVIAEYTLDNEVNNGIKEAFPLFQGVQKVYEITNGDVYRKLIIEGLQGNKFSASVTVHTPEEFNGMRMFVTEDGSTGITLTKEGFLGGAFSSSEKPNNLAQLMVLGIKEGATTAECFDTVLPDYYANFGFKAVSRTAFNDEFKPMIANGNTVKDWDYETYKKFNNGRPDVVFLIYDGGDRNTIEERLGQFDLYKTYEKENTQAFDKDGYDSAEAIMKQMAIKTIEHYEEQAAPEADINELMTADTKDPAVLEKIFNALDGIDKSIDKFLKSGPNSVTTVIPLGAMKIIVKALKALVKGGMMLQDAIKKVAADNNVKEADIISSLTIINSTEANVPEGLSEGDLPGFDRMMEQVEGIVQKSKDKGLDEAKIKDNVMQYVMKSKVYETASDIQREKLVREVNKMFGVREKSAPSVGRILGTIKDINKITMSEKDALKKQLKDYNKGANNATAAWAKASTDLTKAIKEMANSGKLTLKQVANVLRKFSSVNMFKEGSIDNFVDYMSNVFQDAEYADKINTIKKQLPTARKNVKTKLGAAMNLIPSMERLFSINPDLIPSSALDSYILLVDMMGKRQETLDLIEINVATRMTNTVLDAVDEEQSKAEELSDRFDWYSDPVLNDDGSINYADTIKAMLKDGTITEEDAELMRKYKSTIMPRPDKAEMTEQEIEDEKQALIDSLNNITLDPSKMASIDDRRKAISLKELLKTEAIKRLNAQQLKNLIKVVNAINNGYFPHSAQLVIERLNAINNAISLVTAIQEAKPLPLTKIYARIKNLFTDKSRTPIQEMVIRGPLYFIDQLFGDFKTKRVFNAVFNAAAQGQAAYDAQLNRVNRQIDNARNAVAKSFGMNPNKTVMSSYKMMSYMIQNEYLSNPDSNQVNPAHKYLAETIKFLENDNRDAQANMLQDILDNYTDTDGNIDANKLYNSFNKAEREALKVMREINDGLTDKAVHTAGVIRGQKISPLNNYVHMPVISDFDTQNTTSITAAADAYNRALMPSTKGKSLIERDGQVHPLNFDVFASVQQGSKSVLMDYNLTEPIRTARKTLAEAEKMMAESGRISKEKRQIFGAIKKSFNQATEDLLLNNYISTSFGDDVMNFITKQGYRAILASAPRFVSELISNIGYAVISDPRAFAAGLSHQGFLMTPGAVDVMNNVRSKQIGRLFHGDALSGRFVDTSILSQKTGIKAGQPKSAVRNIAEMIYNRSLKKYKNAIELTADTLISTPDKLVMRPIWFGAFANKFESITGTKVDFEKIAANDESYMNQHKAAIEQATTTADDKSVLAGATDNAYMGILKGKSPNQSAALKAFHNFNNFMTRFAIYEYTSARTGIYAMVGKGSISKKDGAALLAGVTTRMVVYSMLTYYLGTLMLSMFSDEPPEDEEDEKTFMQKFGQAFTSAATGMLLGRDFGNATRGIINYGLEEMNEKFLTGLRNGEYDPYKDAISYSIMPKEKKGQKTNLSDFLMIIGGSMGPALKTLDLAIRKIYEAPKKEAGAIQRQKDEIEKRIPLEIAGNLGFIPLYKDVRKVIVNNIYSSLREEQKADKIKKQEKEAKEAIEDASDLDILNKMKANEFDSKKKRIIEEKINKIVNETPEEKEARKEANILMKERKKVLLGEYDNQTDMKRRDRDMWEKNFGPNSDWGKENKLENEIDNALDKERQRIEDEMNDYVPNDGGLFGTSGSKKNQGLFKSSDGGEGLFGTPSSKKKKKW